MKKHLILPFILVLTIISCGKDGKDGIAYLQINWDPYVYSYWDDNPDTPDIIKNSDNYRVYPGIYHYEYLWKDLQGNSYGEEGTYEIFINKGEKGGFLKTGKDGESEYFELYLHEDNGPNVTEKSKALNKKQSLSVMKAAEVSNKIYTDNTEYDTIYSHRFTMIVSRKKFRLIK